MRASLTFLLAALFCCGGNFAHGADSTALVGLFGETARPRETNTTARLVLPVETARAGDTVLAGVHLHMSPGWHTYWKNPGEAGIATSIKWDLPKGVTAGEIQWPTPQKHSEEGLITFAYFGDAVLLIPLKLASNLKPGAIELKATVKWLECKESCIPGNTNVGVVLAIGTETKPSKDADFIAAAEMKLPKPGEPSPDSTLTVRKSVEPKLSQPLALMLLYAFIGGLILNVMPCVLPVIALKILGFVSQARDEPGRVRKLGLIYGAGVLVSFLALASLVIGVKAAGHRAGWGMQFGNPQFIVALVVLVTLVALNLFGLFEINLGSGAMNAAGALASKHGAAGAFFNGVLATALATPCTAPFLGAALGFAFAQTAAIIVLIFLTVGLGLASPYIVLSWQPAWLKFLPKPGAWMERFKIAMGFPMLATAIWLFGLLPLYYGKRAWWLGIFLVVLGLAAWVYGEFVQRGRARRGVAIVVTLALLVSGYAYAIEKQLRWREPNKDAGAAGSLKESPDGIDWERWSPAAVAKAQAEGHPVLVDFTADWCLTCQANKKIAIEIPSVRKKLKEINAVALLGDYTRLPDDITDELNRFGRAGVPLVLVYPASTNASPIVLPEVLAPHIVLRALEQAGK